MSLTIFFFSLSQTFQLTLLNNSTTTGETSRGLICFNKFIDVFLFFQRFNLWLSLSGREHTTSQSERIKQGNQRTNVTRNCKSFSILSQRWDSCAIKAFDDIFFCSSPAGGREVKRHEITYECFIICSREWSKRAGTLLTLRNDFNLWCDGRRETMETARYDPKILGKYLSSLFHVSLLLELPCWSNSDRRETSVHTKHTYKAP